MKKGHMERLLPLPVSYFARSQDVVQVYSVLSSLLISHSSRFIG